jgi:hypothetical protein
MTEPEKEKPAKLVLENTTERPKLHDKPLERFYGVNGFRQSIRGIGLVDIPGLEERPDPDFSPRHVDDEDIHPIVRMRPW